MTGWSGPSIGAAGDAEQQAVADLAGGAGDGDANGLVGTSLLDERKDEAAYLAPDRPRRLAPAEAAPGSRLRRLLTSARNSSRPNLPSSRPLPDCL